MLRDRRILYNIASQIDIPEHSISQSASDAILNEIDNQLKIIINVYYKITSIKFYFEYIGRSSLLSSI